MNAHAPSLAAALSLIVPGLGQLRNGERAKGIAILCITAGIWSGILVATLGPPAFRSWLTVGVLALVYLFVWIPAIVDAYQRAAGIPTTLLSGGKRWYVILMLLTVGPMALPLLWQSPRFSQRAKIVWTIAVILIALVGLVVLVVVGPLIERTLREATAILNTLP